MRKILLAIFILTVVQTVSKAQLSISPHVAPAFPLGVFNNIAHTGTGFGVEGTYAINDNLRAGIAVDHYHFKAGAEVFGINLGGLLFGGIDYKIIPVTGTVQYMLSIEGIRPYVGFEAGVYNFSVENISRTYFGLAPTLGLLYPINEKLDFFANAKYQVMYVDETIPLIERKVNQNLYFLPVNVGISFKFSQ